MDDTIQLDRTEFSASLPPPVPTDDVSAEPLYEVMYVDSWVVTDPDIWRSWTGERMINGEVYHGPVYNLGSDTLYTGARVCSCRACEQQVEHALKKN